MARRGKTRRMRGGFNLKKLVLAALAGLSLQQPSSALTWKELSSGPMSKERIGQVAQNVVTWVATNRPKSIAEVTLPNVEETLQSLTAWMNTPSEPVPHLTASKMRDGRSYTWKGKTFEVGSWETLQNGMLKVTPMEGDPFTIGINEPVEEVPEPVEESGGRRRKRNKTLRRKK